MRTALLTRRAVAVTAAAAMGVLGLSAPAIASAAAQRAAAHLAGHPAGHPAVVAHAFARPALPPGQRYACPAPTRPGQVTCMSIVHAASLAGLTPVPGITPAANGFYRPKDLRSAYKVAAAAARQGRGKTVAIVDAFNDPHAEADLKVYRSHFHLPRCTRSNGCLRIVNEHGRTSPLPRADAGWAVEISLDLDMVSAICPRCHILLVEAKNAQDVSLGTAENTAIAKGAKFVSNSWGSGEFAGQDFFSHFFNHPGRVISFASGDFGLGATWPADLQYVTSVGGTALRHASNGRGWTESVWGSSGGRFGTASGCSVLEAKASWQRGDAKEPGGCLNRTENDIAAVADPNTGVLVYDTYRAPGGIEVGGTSAATPIVTAIYALAGNPARNTYPAQYPYLHRSRMFDVTSGVNGSCETFRKYLCHGVRGFDGPTGLGTPNGSRALGRGQAHRITLVDPGTKDRRAGQAFSLKITGLDTRKVSSLHFSATGLPSGLSIHAVPHSTNGVIRGMLPAAPGTFHVTVTAADGSAKGSTHFTIVTVASLSLAASASGEVSLRGTLCLDDGGGGAGTAVRIQSCTASAAELWQYQSAGGPDDIGRLIAQDGSCLQLSSTRRGVLATCGASGRQRWEYLGGGALWNPATGGCLAVPSQTAGIQVTAAPCTFGPRQTWNLPPGPLTSGVSQGGFALCLSNPSGSQVTVDICGNSAATQWVLKGDGTIRSSTGGCLTTGGSLLSGTAVTTAGCSSHNANEHWFPGPRGSLINPRSGRCLADPGNGGPATGLRQEDCYGEAGEIWGLN